MRSHTRSRRRTLAALTCTALALPLLALPAAAVPVPGLDVLYTEDADFDQGALQDVNHDAPNNDQLQLNR